MLTDAAWQARTARRWHTLADTLYADDADADPMDELPDEPQNEVR
jgi:hypothetical protein